MKFTQKQIAIVGAAALLVIIALVAVYFGVRSTSQNAKVTLNIWGTDPKSVFEDIAAAYKTIDPGFTLIYTQVDPADYDNQLLKAFAAGDGPDAFEINNRELPKWLSVTTPVPAALLPTFNITTLQSDFPTVVGQDFVSGGQIYGLPLDLDTLAMFYNKDLFDSAGIVYPPKTWDDFEADIPKLRTLNDQGQLTQAAAALGGSQASIADADDLVYLFMLQNGTRMTSENNFGATFNGGGENGSNPGLAAFNFYLQFSDSASPYYTWDDAMGDSVQSFIGGKVAIMFDYANSVAEIKQKAPFLNFGIAPMPQPTGATIDVNYPEYQGLVVSKRGQAAAAWQFILFATTNSAGEQVYTKDTGELPASRAYIAANLNDPTYGTFAAQSLTARSWYEADDVQIDSIMNTAIQNVLNGSMDSSQALGVAQSAVTTVMQSQ